MPSACRQLAQESAHCPCEQLGIFDGQSPNTSRTISVNAIIKVSATSLSTDYSNSLPGVSFVAGSDSAEF
jgi:hypothetical protein